MVLDDFTDPNKEVVMTYIDLDKYAKESMGLCLEMTEKWSEHEDNMLFDILDKLSNNDEEGAKHSLLEALESARKLSSEMAEKMAKSVAEWITDAYQVGHTEGAGQCQQHNKKILTEMMEAGLVEDSVGALKKYLELVDEMHAKHTAEKMKGKTLNFYSTPKPKEED